MGPEGRRARLHAVLAQLVDGAPPLALERAALRGARAPVVVAPVVAPDAAAAAAACRALGVVLAVALPQRGHERADRGVRDAPAAAELARALQRLEALLQLARVRHAADERRV